MIFITLGKFRKKPTKETAAATDKSLSRIEKAGAKVLRSYWTLGRYDAIIKAEIQNELEAMQEMRQRRYYG